MLSVAGALPLCGKVEGHCVPLFRTYPRLFLSDMGRERLPGREMDPKSGAVRLIRGHPHTPTMRLYNGAAD
jgi:hypothetical protein